MGSAAAFHLAKRGKRVLGLDQYAPAHDRGSSHGASRIIRQAYYEDPAYVPLLQRAYELWRELDSDLLSITGGLMVGTEQSAVVRGTLASARQHHLSYQVFDANELRRRYPVLNPREQEVAVYEPGAGFLRPELCVRTHLEKAARAGAELHFEEPVISWQAHAPQAGVTVVTNRGSYHAEKLVIAPGAWAPQILAGVGVAFEIRRHVMCWFDPLGGAAAFLPEHFPVYLWDVGDGSVFYGFPATDGLGGGVKAAMHSGGDLCTPASLDRTVHTRDLEELRAPLSRFIPSLDGPLLNGAACMYTMTKDEHFVLALHPDHPQVAVAAGFSGHGFKFTTVVGEILADLACAGRTAHPIDLFSPQRTALQECGAAWDASANA